MQVRLRYSSCWRQCSRSERPTLAAPPTAVFAASDLQALAMIDALDALAKETGKTVPQVALNWLFQRPTVSTVVLGARNEEQLKQNLGAVGWNLTADQAGRRVRLTGPNGAIAARDPDAAAYAMRRHILLSRDRFLDGTTVADLPRAVEVVPTDGASLVAALR